MQYKVKVQTVMLGGEFDTQDEALAAGREEARAITDLRHWPTQFRLMGVDERGPFTLDTFVAEIDGTVRRVGSRRVPFRAMAASCSQSSDSIHRDGDLCGTCHHRHCVSCWYCPSCVAKTGETCTGFTVHNGARSDGRRLARR